MSQIELTGPAAPPKAWPMYRAMVGIGILCGLLIVTVYQVTKPVIERNKAEALQRAIFQVLPDARASATYALGEDGRFGILEGEAAGLALIHVGWTEENELAGFAIEAHGMGYQDVIRILYGYSAAAEAVIGIRVLESKETPGLGDRIETDPAFLENFVRLDVALTADGSAISNPIVAVKSGTKQNPWEIDGITGATISSVAIADILRESTAHWAPLVRASLDQFGPIEPGESE